MKIIDLQVGIAVITLFVSAMAGAETRYPDDFQPVILYQDAELIAKSVAEPSKPDEVSKVSTKPTLVESADDAKKSVAVESGGVVESGKATETVAVAEKSGAIESAVTVERAGVSENLITSETTDQLLLQNIVIVLIIAGLGGFMFWRRKPKTKVSTETGVARYLKTLTSMDGGVVSLTSSKITGVARYLKNLEASAKATVAQTGVAKYLAELDK